MLTGLFRVWGGAAYTDNCGDCVEGTTARFACIEDCLGIWGGGAADECGVCVGPGTGLPACEPDCKGVYGGPAVLIDCLEGTFCVASADDVECGDPQGLPGHLRLQWCL